MKKYTSSSKLRIKYPDKPSHTRCWVLSCLCLPLFAMFLASCDKKVPNSHEVKEFEEWSIVNIFGTVPSELFACGNNNIFPYMTLDYEGLKRGEIVELSADKQSSYSYIYDFSPIPYVVKGNMVPNLVTYVQANKEAFLSDEYKNMKGEKFLLYSYGLKDPDKPHTFWFQTSNEQTKGVTFERKRKTLFYAELYSCRFSVEADLDDFLSSDNMCAVSSIYNGACARLVVSTDLDPWFVVGAYRERCTIDDSKDWKEVVNNSDVYVSVSAVAQSDEAVSDDTFFSVIKGDKQNISPIFFRVTR